ncbi:MAG: SDR family oxidoreductase [Verrucomicrobium sp.]|nr:SDR family oxidoreductase [Verrucomicrobium sp.]
MSRFAGWTALLTGASAGLGAEFARQLAPRLEGGILILTARRADRLAALAGELKAAHPALTLHTFTADLADPPSVAALGGMLEEAGLRPDLLVNNAGLGDIGLFETAAPERLDAMLRVNVEALTVLTRALLPGMVRRGRGTVVNVGSVAGFLALPTFAVYAATKAYVNSFSEALAWELKGTGVTVTAVCPGPVPTEFSEVAYRTPGAGRAMGSPRITRVPAGQAVAESLRAAEKGNLRITPGFVMGLAAFFTNAAPLWLRRLAYRTTVAQCRAQRKAS